MNPHKFGLANPPARTGKNNVKNLLATCVLLGTASFAHGQWTGTGSNLRYEDTANWNGGIINDTFSGTLGWTNNWNVNFGSRTLPGNFTYKNLDPVNTVKFTPDGNAVWKFTSDQPTFHIEGDTTYWRTIIMGADSRPFSIDFSNKDAVFAISPNVATYMGGFYNTLQLQAVINNANSITKTGAGILRLDRQVNITNGGALNVLNGVVRLQHNPNSASSGVLRGASAINLTGRGSVLDIGPGASGVNFLETTTPVHIKGGALAFGLSGNSTQQVGAVTLEGARGVIGNYHVDGTSLATVELSSLTRKNDATLNLALTNVNNGASTLIKISGDDSNILASLVGGGGAAGSTNISIVPWMTASFSANYDAFTSVGNDASWAGGSFVTYTHDGGFRALTNDEYYIANETANFFYNAGSTDNVAIGAGALTVSQNQTINSLRFNAGSTATIAAGQTLTITSGAINDQGFAYTLNGPGKISSGNNPFIFTGRNRATVNAELTNNLTDPNATAVIIGQVGSGVHLGGTQNYVGTTVVQGSLVVKSNSALPSATTVQLDKSGTIAIESNVTASATRLTGSGTLLFNAVNASSQFNLGGGIGAGNTITVNAGGILAPGYSNAVDTLTMGNNARDLTINSGGEFRFTLASASEVSMIQNINANGTNTLTINGGTLYLSFLDGYNPEADASWTLTSGFTATNGLASNLTVVDLTHGYSYIASFVDNNLVVSLAAIPEPSTYVSLFGGLTLLGWSLRRRLKAA